VQYDQGAGPCLDALRSGMPVVVPDVPATMQWPGFCTPAFEMGRRASVSIPLFARRGTTIPTLNLYGHGHAAMSQLISRIIALTARDRH
jgi:hypothetical protein